MLLLGLFPSLLGEKEVCVQPREPSGVDANTGWVSSGVSHLVCHIKDLQWQRPHLISSVLPGDLDSPGTEGVFSCMTAWKAVVQIRQGSLLWPCSSLGSGDLCPPDMVVSRRVNVTCVPGTEIVRLVQCADAVPQFLVWPPVLGFPCLAHEEAMQTEWREWFCLFCAHWRVQGREMEPLTVLC